MKRLAFVWIILLVMLLSAFSSMGQPAYGPPADEDQPTLMVQKMLDTPNQIVLGDTITVTVNITNFSDAYAYNVSVFEPKFQPTVVGSQLDYTNYKWVRLGLGASVVYSYEITPRVTGQFTLEPTVVEYVDEDGFEYEDKSQYIPITVVEEEVITDTDVLWEDIAYWSLGLIAIPIIVYYANQIIKR